MKTRLPEPKPVDVNSIEWILECAAVLGWNDLLGHSPSERVQIAYEGGMQGELDHLKLWSSPKRGEWDLVCDYWMNAGDLYKAGTTFSTGYSSGVLERALDFIMRNQAAFTRALRKASGLIQASKPTADELQVARETMATAMARSRELVPATAGWKHCP